MQVSYTNRKGQTYLLYRGQTKNGKPRYYFARAGQSQGEAVTELPPGFAISESVNGVVSLVKDRPPLIEPAEVASVEQVLKQHPQTRRYRVAVKSNRIEIYQPLGPTSEEMADILQRFGPVNHDLLEQWLVEQDRSAQYTPVLRFTLFDADQRRFNAERMCYLGDIDDWLELGQTGSAAALARTLVPLLGTEEFFELW